MAQHTATIQPGLLRRIGQYLSLIKFSHTVFALPFALIGFTLGCLAVARNADGYFTLLSLHTLSLLIKVLLCMVFARSAAMAFNRYLDRRFDALNPRTQSREIPAGIIAPRQALWFTIACCALFVLTTWFINLLVFYLSFVALLVILFYSYTKRVTALCHLVLGVGLSLAPVGAYLAITGRFDVLPVLFSCIVLTWVGGFDVIYALQDRDFDRGLKLHSIPAAVGLRGALVISAILHILTAGLVIAAGVYGHFNLFFWAGAMVFTGLLLYQHLIVSPTDLSRVNLAFANTNGLASILFAVFTITSLLTGFHF